MLCWGLQTLLVACVQPRVLLRCEGQLTRTKAGSHGLRGKATKTLHPKPYPNGNAILM